MNNAKGVDMLLIKINKKIYDDKTDEVMEIMARKLKDDLPLSLTLMIGVVLADAFEELSIKFFGRGDSN